MHCLFNNNCTIQCNSHRLPIVDKWNNNQKWNLAPLECIIVKKIRRFPLEVLKFFDTHCITYEWYFQCNDLICKFPFVQQARIIGQSKCDNNLYKFSQVEKYQHFAGIYFPGHVYFFVKGEIDKLTKIGSGKGFDLWLKFHGSLSLGKNFAGR